MNAEDLRTLLADRAGTVETSHPARVAEVRGRIRTARRRRVAATSAGAAGLVLAVVVVSATLTGTNGRTQDPIGDPTPAVPTPTLRVPTPPVTDLPNGQTLVTADLRPEVLQPEALRWDDGVTHTTEDDPGATELDEVVAARTLYFALEGFCRGDQGTWWVMTSSYGSGGYGQCGVEAPLSAPAPVDVSAADPFSPKQWTSDEWARWHSADDQDTVGTEELWEPDVHMFLTAEVPQKVRDCVDEEIAQQGLGLDACFDPGFDDSLARGLEVLDSTDATFGFTLYQELAPHVATVLGQGFEALAVVDGTGYLFSHAVEAPQTTTLTLDLEPSERPRLIGVRTQRARSAELELRVDGQPPADREDPPFFGRIPALTATTLVPPGAHTVSVDLVNGNPDKASLAVVVYEAAQ